jgi:hypothetical protein
MCPTCSSRWSAAPRGSTRWRASQRSPTPLHASSTYTDFAAPDEVTADYDPAAAEPLVGDPSRERAGEPEPSASSSVSGEIGSLRAGPRVSAPLESRARGCSRAGSRSRSWPRSRGYPGVDSGSPTSPATPIPGIVGELAKPAGDGWFEPVEFVGAFAGPDDDWSNGWAVWTSAAQPE